MSSFLLDINVLIALGFPRHPDSVKVETWCSNLPRRSRFLTCSITEIGFLRVSLQAKLAKDMIEARAVLAGLLRSRRFHRVGDDLGASDLPGYVSGPRQITDAHLAGLALRYEAKLATLDTAIPRALLIG